MCMNIVFIGCVEFSHSALTHLLELALPGISVTGVVTRRESSFNADFRALEDIASIKGIPCFVAEGNNQAEMAGWLERCSPDVVYCFGWSYLLEPRILDIPRLGVIGYHPAALPSNRGRHPIIWALVLGLSETASTFFFMDEGADSGDIISQVFVPIAPSDRAATLYQKLTETSLQQIADFTTQLLEGTYSRIPQNHSQANYWRKRSKADGQIDWRMPAENIHNLVRALSKPYPGAHCIYQGNEVKIWKTVVLDTDIRRNIEPGKVVKLSGANIQVKCGEGVLELLCHDFKTIPDVGTYL